MAVKFLVDLLSGNLVMVNVAGGGVGSGVDNLLLETDDNFLLEDGSSVILLE